MFVYVLYIFPFLFFWAYIRSLVSFIHCTIFICLSVYLFVSSGYGEFLCISGYRYYGEWKQDRRTGVGVLYRAALDDTYEGEFKDNFEHGEFGEVIMISIIISIILISILKQVNKITK